LTGNNIAGMK